MLRKWIAGMLAAMMLCGNTAYAYDHRQEDAALRAKIEEWCDFYGVPVLLVCAVIDRESGWDADAVNAAGSCYGLMQINEVNFRHLERELILSDLTDPYQNVQAGIYMLAGYIERYLDYHMALMCYNCGEAGARKRWAQGQYESEYSCWVMERMHDLEWEALCAARERLRGDSSDE